MLSRMIKKALCLGVVLLAPAAAKAQDCYHCQRTHCPPHLKHCMEGPPHICFQRGCPRPICDPCMNPNWGYYETCWSPWPWTPDFSHCRTLPPAATIGFNPVGLGMPQVQTIQPDTTLPMSRPLR